MWLWGPSPWGADRQKQEIETLLCRSPAGLKTLKYQVCQGSVWGGMKHRNRIQKKLSDAPRHSLLASGVRGSSSSWPLRNAYGLRCLNKKGLGTSITRHHVWSVGYDDTVRHSRPAPSHTLGPWQANLHPLGNQLGSCLDQPNSSKMKVNLRMLSCYLRTQSALDHLSCTHRPYNQVSMQRILRDPLGNKWVNKPKTNKKNKQTKIGGNKGYTDEK